MHFYETKHVKMKPVVYRSYFIVRIKEIRYNPIWHDGNMSEMVFSVTSRFRFLKFNEFFKKFVEFKFR